MKKSAVLLLLVSSLFLAGCDHTPANSQASSSASVPASTSTSPDQIRLTATDAGSYCQGMVYQKLNKLVVVLEVKKADGIISHQTLSSLQYRIVDLEDSDGLSHAPLDTLDKVGNYTVNLSYGDYKTSVVITVAPALDAYDTLTGITLSDTASRSGYVVGDVLKSSATLVVTASWKYRGEMALSFDETGATGYQFALDGWNYSTAPDGTAFDPSTPFVQGGSYLISVRTKIHGNTLNSNVLSYLVDSGMNRGYAPKSLVLTDATTSYSVGDSFLSKAKLNFHVSWDTTPAREEDIAYNSANTRFGLSLVKAGTTIDVLSSPLEKSDYVLTGTFTASGKTVSATWSFSVKDIVKQVQSLSFAYEDVKPYGSSNVKATGNQKVLVIPTYFSDETYNSTVLANYHTTIQKGFFGTNAECGWRSFAGYYEEASLGTLHYSGMVADSWYKSTSSVAEVNASADLTSTIASQALAWFKTTYPAIDLSAYDTDNDNNIDSLYIIYAHDAGDWGSGLWGFRSSTSVQAGSSGKQASAFSWFSMSFLNNLTAYGGVPDGGINTRIIIHEHGHMLGIPDYYDYTYSGPEYVGSYDMQSDNYLDWNSVSKFLVGWVKPYYIDNTLMEIGRSVSVSLNPAATSGDCLFLRNVSDWNGSPCDEYLMLDLFNGSLGNNAYDAGNLAEKGVWSSASLYGVKILHADARLYGFNVDGANYGTISKGKLNSLADFSYADNMVDNNYAKTYDTDGTTVTQYHNFYFEDGLAQEAGYEVPSEYKDFHFLEMLQKGGSATFKSTSSANRKKWNGSDLWEAGNTFSLTSQSGYTAYGPSFFARKTVLNDGSVFPFAISFDSVSPTKATLTIKRVA
jgi:M6 family metalloprotease-like protein